LPATSPDKIPLVFFRTISRSEPVRTWLKSLERTDRLRVGADLLRVQYRWPVGMPLCRSLGSGLWEVRTPLAGGRTARVLIGFHGGVLYALEGFLKTTQATPRAVLELGRSRLKEVQNDRET